MCVWSSAAQLFDRAQCPEWERALRERLLCGSVTHFHSGQSVGSLRAHIPHRGVKERVPHRVPERTQEERHREREGGRRQERAELVSGFLVTQPRTSPSCLRLCVSVPVSMSTFVSVSASLCVHEYVTVPASVSLPVYVAVTVSASVCVYRVSVCVCGPCFSVCLGSETQAGRCALLHLCFHLACPLTVHLLFACDLSCELPAWNPFVSPN